MDRIVFYVICMRGKADRERSADAISRSLRSRHASASVVVVDAIDGRQQSRRELELKGLLAPPNREDGWLYDMYGRKIIDGQIGCALSHAKVQALVAAQDREFGVVFEDDVELLDDFVEKIEALVARIDTTVELADADLLNLYMFDHDKVKLDVAGRPPGTFVKVPFRGYWGTQCLFCFRRTAEKVLSNIVPVRDPVDDQLASSTTGLVYLTICGSDFVRLVPEMPSAIFGGVTPKAAPLARVVSSIGGRLL